MPVFNYKAFKEDGSSDAGVIDADSPKEARLKLRTKKLLVTDLAPVGGEGAGAKKIRIPFLRRRNVQEISIITRQMATLLGSGIPMMGALTAVIEQAESRDLKTVMMDIREKVATGGTFSDALALHPFHFNELYVNMVKAGEAAGNLDKVLYRLSDYLHAQNKMQAKIVAALTYPIIMLIIGVGVVAVLMTFVVPKIMDVIQKQGQEAALPLPTTILLTVSGFFANYWWLLLGLTVCGSLVWTQILRMPAGRLWWDTTKLQIPVVGPLMRKSAISRFALTFATLLESGLPVLEALNVVKRVVNNQVLANALDMVRQKIAEGQDIATPLKASKLFPPVVGYMIAVGEEGGKLEELLKKIAEAYDEEVEIAAQRMTSLLEPIMIVVMAVVVGFIVMSVLLPILQMSNL
ncbi:MAG: type II secretion system inner membrane protein GspF [Planctomycetes bacterium]|nr:type II secretion system inner membrane protein GspF [Planctomycetota bacterium]